MRQISHKSIPCKKRVVSPKKILPNQDRDAIAALEKKFKFTYDYQFNHGRNRAHLSMLPLPILHGQLGVFAEKPLKKTSRMIGCYAGRRVKVGQEYRNNDYVFEITNDDNEVLFYLDGKKDRDWSNFVNHSNTPNLSAVQRKIKGQFNICFYVSKPIREGDQLLFDYGKFYFNGAKQLYMHASDNWQRTSERYTTQNAHYLPGTYRFDAAFSKAMDLRAREWVLPKTFAAIYAGNAHALKALIKKGASVELPALALTKKRAFASNNQQEHVTALMFAAYLGRKNCVEVLLKAQADADRCLLHKGFSALTLLCKSKLAPDAVDTIGQLLLKKMCYPFVVDSKQQTAVYYASTQSIRLTEKILKRLKAEEDELAEFIDEDMLIKAVKQKKTKPLRQLFKIAHQLSLDLPKLSNKSLKLLTKKQKAVLDKLYPS